MLAALLIVALLSGMILFGQLDSEAKNIDGFENNLKDKVHFASKVDLAFNRLQEILSLIDSNPDSNQYQYFKKFTALKTELDSAININEERHILEQLNELRKHLE
jgi:hypothetical protein